VEQVVLHHARILVGDVLKLLARAHIAEREDAVRGGSLVRVYHDQSIVICLNLAAWQVEGVAVRGAPGRHQ
jgi:hypothetical protein